MPIEDVVISAPAWLNLTDEAESVVVNPREICCASDVSGQFLYYLRVPCRIAIVNEIKRERTSNLLSNAVSVPVIPKKRRSIVKIRQPVLHVEVIWSLDHAVAAPDRAPIGIVIVGVHPIVGTESKGLVCEATDARRAIRSITHSI